MASLTPAASEVASLAGVQTSFAQSAEITLQKLCGLRLSESTVERVTEAAGARLAQGSSPSVSRHVEAWCHLWKHTGGLRMVRVLEAIDPTTHSASARQALDDCLRYFKNHQHRMDYPRYVAHGWQIGSGPVESACKTVVANRLKGSGMRWSTPGSDAVCHLPALYLSETGQWESFWRDYPN